MTVIDMLATQLLSETGRQLVADAIVAQLEATYKGRMTRRVYIKGVLQG